MVDRKTLAELENEFRVAIKQLEGRVLREVRLQIIAPEINVVVLVTDDETFNIQGVIGGELLELVAASAREVQGPHAWYEGLEPAAKLLGSRIVQARAIGEAWNGHGLELSFEGVSDTTLVVQSIYSGETPPEFNDCLRVGIATYQYRSRHGPAV
jgi:hypothetical protein